MADSGPAVVNGVEPVTPRMLSRYVLADRLGEGGRGVVYRAFDPMLGRPVAVKLLRTDVAGGDDRASDRLVREAQAIARFSHPNVVAVHDVGTYERSESTIGVFIVMELVEGGTIAQWLRRENPDWQAVRRVFLQAGRGLEAAHAAGLIHRDFKPSNVLLGDDGRARVVDFGFARPARSGPEVLSPEPEPSNPSSGSLGSTAFDDPITEAGAAVGTPAYMAPEQHVGGEVDGRSDQYAFCVALYEALYGKRPFAGRGAKRLAHAKFRGLERAPSDASVPDHLARLVMRGLSPYPEGRFATMTELLEQLAIDPIARRRRRLLTAGGILAVFGFGGGVVLQGERMRAECEEQTADVAGAWGEETRASVRDAFVADGRAFTPGASAYVQRRLDAHAAAWTAAAYAVCIEAEHATPERETCLAFGEASVAAIANELTTGGPKTLEFADDLVAQIETLENCEARERRRDRGLDPKVVQLRTMLVRADIERAIFRSERASNIAREVLTEAEARGNRALAARAMLLLGRTSDLTYQQPTLRDAWAAAEAAGDERTAVEAATELTLAVALVGDRQQEATTLAAVLRGKLDALEGEPLIAAAGYDRLARVLGMLDRPAEADAAALKSMNLFERELGPNTPRLVPSLLLRVGPLKAAGRLDDALEIVDRAERIVANGLGPSHPDIIAVTNARALVEWASGRSDEAVERLRVALELTRQVHGPRSVEVAHQLDQLGDILVARGETQEALAVKRDALEIRDRTLPPTHPLLLRTKAKLAMGLLNAGRPDEALVQMNAVVATFGPEDQKTVPVALAEHLRRLGYVLEELGREADALQAFSRAEAAFAATAHDRASEFNLAALRGAIGRQHIALGNVERARTLLESALAVTESLPDTDGRLARIRFDLARAIVDTEPARAADLATRADTTYTHNGEKGRHAAAVREWLEAHGH